MAESIYSPFVAAKSLQTIADPSLLEEGQCHAIAGNYVPVVNRSKCEGKKECVSVCPYNVFEVRTMEATDFQSLPILARLKSLMHGRLTAYSPRAGLCEACGLCAASCPEQAISIVRI